MKTHVFDWPVAAASEIQALRTHYVECFAYDLLGKRNGGAS